MGEDILTESWQVSGQTACLAIFSWHTSLNVEQKPSAEGTNSCAVVRCEVTYVPKSARVTYRICAVQETRYLDLKGFVKT